MNQTAISSQTIMRVTVTILSLWFLYLIRDIIALLIIAVIITAALGPIINYLERWHLPRALTVACVYIVFFTGLSMLIAVIVPTLTEQIELLLASLLQDIASVHNGMLSVFFGSVPTNLAAITDPIAGSFGELFSRTASLFSAIVAVFAVISMSFYMSLQRDGMKRFLLSLTPKQHQPYVASLTDRIQESFGRWVAGQLVTMIFVGVLYFVVLSIFGVPYALTLATIGGILEIVPYLGPILSAIPAAILGFSVAPAVGFVVIIGYILINFVENYVLIPQIMNKAVGLNPVAVILALLIGAKIAGLIGVIIAVPIAGALSLFVKDVLEKKIS